MNNKKETIETLEKTNIYSHLINTLPEVVIFTQVGHKFIIN
jgi:hypothetical protein